VIYYSEVEHELSETANSDDAPGVQQSQFNYLQLHSNRRIRQVDNFKSVFKERYTKRYHE
jgi:hypothetical protein